MAGSVVWWRRRWTLLVALLAVMAVVVGVAAFWVLRDPEGTAAADGSGAGFVVGPDGGEVGEDGGPRVLVPAGALDAETEVVFAAGEPVDPVLGGDEQVATAIGEQVDITFAGGAQPQGVQVVLPVDPGAVPVLDGGPVPPQAVTVAVYNEGVGTWLPIPSVYDPAAGTVSGYTPHFSRFQVFGANVDLSGVGDTLRRVAGEAVDFGQGAVDAATVKARQAAYAYQTFVETMFKANVEFVQDAAQDVGQAFGVVVQEADCDQASTEWTVETSLAEVTGCMVVNPDGSGVLRLTNSTWMSYVVKAPEGFGLALNQYDAGSSAGTLLSRVIHAPFGLGVLPARGPTEMAVSAESMQALEQAGRTVEVSLRPDWEGYGIDATLVALVFVPNLRVEVSAISITIKRELTVITERAVLNAWSRTDILLEVARLVPAVGGILPAAQVVVEAVDCGSAAVGTLLASDPNEQPVDNAENVRSAIIKQAAECAITAITAVTGREADAAKGEVLGLLAVFPDTFKTLAAKLQNDAFLVLGEIFQTVSVTPPGPTLFTDQGNLFTCGAAPGYTVVCQDQVLGNCGESGLVGLPGLTGSGGYDDLCGSPIFDLAQPQQVLPDGSTLEFTVESTGEVVTCRGLSDGVECLIPGGEGFRITLDGLGVYEDGVLISRD